MAVFAMTIVWSIVMIASRTLSEIVCRRYSESATCCCIANRMIWISAHRRVPSSLSIFCAVLGMMASGIWAANSARSARCAGVGRDANDRRGGHGVGQVTGTSQGLVMFVRGHLHDLHAQGRPEGARPFQTVKRGERRGCDHADAAVAQVGPSVGHPFLLGPGDRVPAHERCSAPFVGLDFGHDPPLGAARVGHEQSWSTVTRSRDRVAAHSRDGGADYHDVRFGDGPVQALGPFVDRPDAEGLVDCGRIATDADHAAGQMTSARGQSD